MDTFSTPRLTAEKLQEVHLPDLAALHLDPDVARHLGGIRTRDVTQGYITTSLTHWERYGFGLWALKTTSGEFAGRAGLRHVTVEGVPEIEVAYAFRRELWGQGLATEIAAAIVRIGFEQLRLPALVGLVSIENIASRRVLERCGFHVERALHYKDEAVVLFRKTAWLSRSAVRTGPFQAGPPPCITD